MDISQLFLQRYTVLYDFWLADFWSYVPPALMRQRPHPRVNSIAWILWHISRVEDAGLNLFVTDAVQVLDEDGWQKRLNLPWRHNGNGMDFSEVEELNRQVDLDALRGYSNAVHQRTIQIVGTLEMESLSPVVLPEQVRRILFDQGWARTDTPSSVDNYTGWTKGKFLLNFGLTHPYQHVGEMGVISSLLGIEFG
jgi:hypothetical protein